MKKSIIWCLIMLMAFWLNCFALWESCSDCLIITSADENTRDEELSEAIEWMYENWLTIYNTPETFMINDSLTREQASKFFAQFAETILNQEFTKDIDLSKFSDLEKADPSLTHYIIQANHLWLFQWLNWKFMPRDKLTQAQAITVIIRMIDWKLDESKWYWFRNYFNNANDYWLLKRWDFNLSTLDNTNITRWDTALLLYTLYKYITDANVLGVIEYNNNLVDVALACIDSEDAVWVAYLSWTSEQLKAAINNTISVCMESVNQIKEFWARNGDDTLQKAIINYVSNIIVYYNKMKKIVPYKDIEKLSESQEEAYNKIINEINEFGTKLDGFSDEIRNAQEKFAKKYRYELE